MPPVQVERAFLISDLSGYTALTETHGDIHAAATVTRFEKIARDALDAGARLVEHVGDEVLITTEDPASAVRTAVRLRDAVESEPLFPTVRCGIHAGSVAEHGGRYFGSTLNLTARIAGHARAGQILCSQPVVARAVGLDDVTYRALGSVRFKNVADPVPLFEVVAGRLSEESAVVDPVCRMQVRLASAPARLPFGERTYYFCSFDCARIFAERPEQYVTP